MASTRRNFWLAWVLATVAGGLLSFAVVFWGMFPAFARIMAAVPASNLRDVLQLAHVALAQVVGTAIIAGVQALVLRRVLRRGLAWVAAAAVGALIAWLVVHWLLGVMTPHSPPPTRGSLRLEGLILACSGTFVLASCLWVACLRSADRAGWFITASVVASAATHWYGLPLLAAAAQLPSANFVLLDIEFAVLLGVVNGALTGLALALTLIRPGQASRRTGSRPARESAKRRPARAGSR